MSTTRTFQIAKSTNYLLKARARGYYDLKQIVNYGADNPQLNLDMTVYDGLKTEYRNGYNTTAQLITSGTVLPYGWDYLNYLFNNYYCLMPKGTEYKDLIFQSSTYYMNISGCTITEDNQCTLTSGVSAVFNSSKIIPTTATSVKMIFKMTLTDNSTSQVITRINTGNKTAQSYVQSSGYYKGYFNSAVGGVTPLTANTTYWFGVLEDTSTIKGYLLADNGTYTLETLPDFTQWTEEWSQNVTSSYTYKGCSIGFFKHADSQPWLGSIDLNNCKIWVDDEDFWYYGIIDTITDSDNTYLGVFDSDYTDDGTSKTYNIFANGNTDITLTTSEAHETDTWLGTIQVPAHDLYSYSETSYHVYDNFEVVGSGINIDQETGKVSGFSSNSYLDTGYIPVLPLKTPWKMRVRFKYVKTSSFQVYLSGTTYANAPYIAVGTNYLVDCGISDGSSRITWIEGTTVLEDGINYIIEFSYDGNTTYTVRLKREDGSWNTENTYTYDGMAMFGANLCIGRNGSGYARGVIDLSTDTYFEIDGVKTWIPTTAHYTGHWEKIP